MRYLLLLLFTSSCANDIWDELQSRSLVDQIVRPTPWGIARPTGSQDFMDGWDHGCETGINVYGNAAYKATYSFYQDVKRITNSEYYKAWKDAYTYCRWHIYNWTRGWQ